MTKGDMAKADMAKGNMPKGKPQTVGEDKDTTNHKVSPNKANKENKKRGNVPNVLNVTDNNFASKSVIKTNFTNLEDMQVHYEELMEHMQAHYEEKLKTMEISLNSKLDALYNNNDIYYKTFHTCN